MPTPHKSKRIDIAKIRVDAIRAYDYATEGVWRDTRSKWWINTLKTINLSVRSFLNADLQSRACALTYRTLLAIVPALALIFAIGRGFGFQTLLQDELLRVFPAQKTMIHATLRFVDSYLDQASEGIFVGVGIVFLLWTMISLLSNIEDNFNRIWQVKENRSMMRKVTDYTALLLILPILMICSAGMLMMVTKTIQSLFDIEFLTPLISGLMELGSMLFMWLFYAMLFWLIPNTKVKFKYALLAGIISGTGFFILQWIFITGQMYVAKYNAIYGSFSFIPLLLIWLQLVWLVTLSGCLLSYASQNIFLFSFSNEIKAISNRYFEKVTVAVLAVIVEHFNRHEKPLTQLDIVALGIPSRLATEILDKLLAANLISKIVIDEKKEIYGYQPAVNPDDITIESVLRDINTMGRTDFVPDFEKRFGAVTRTLDAMYQAIDNREGSVRIADIKIGNVHRIVKEKQEKN